MTKKPWVKKQKINEEKPTIGLSQSKISNSIESCSPIFKKSNLKILDASIDSEISVLTFMPPTVITTITLESSSFDKLAFHVNEFEISEGMIENLLGGNRLNELVSHFYAINSS